MSTEKHPEYYTPKMWEIVVFVMGSGIYYTWGQGVSEFQQRFTKEDIALAVRRGLIRFRGDRVKPTHRASRWFSRVRWGS